MDLRHYYEKIREVEAGIAEEFTVVVSRGTADGGKEGARSEVGRRLAARMIVEGSARLATAAEKEAFYAAQAAHRHAAEQAAAASKVQFAVLSSSELEKLRGAGKSKG
jgi:hypothetical protein